MNKLIIFIFCISTSSVFGFLRKIHFSFNQLNQSIENEFRTQILNIHSCHNLEVLGFFDVKIPAASANIYNRTCNISILGGFWSFPAWSKASHLLTLCHEIGHFIGGQPKKIENGLERWSSAEGQSDYFAALSCMPKILNSNLFLRTDIIRNQRIDQEARDLCSHLPNWSKNHAIQNHSKESCQITVMAAFESVRQAERILVPQNFWYPNDLTQALSQASDEVVEQTLRGNTDYPSAQCRFDQQVSAAQGNRTKLPCWFKR